MVVVVVLVVVVALVVVVGFVVVVVFVVVVGFIVVGCEKPVCCLIQEIYSLTENINLVILNL